MAVETRYVLRPYRGEGDLPGMVRAFNARTEREGGEDYVTVEEMAHNYQAGARFDPGSDVIVAEAGGEIVGYGRTAWDEVADHGRDYWVIVQADPHHPDALEAIVEWVEGRARAVAAGHPPGNKYLAGWSDEAMSWASTLSERSYQRVRIGATLVRPDLEDIPHRPLPPGIEVRTVEDAHLRSIWEADIQAFRDHWGYVEQTEEDYEKWLTQPHWDPTLWQVAWAGERVVGQVRSFIDEDENHRLGVRRGWTEDISTVREWRGRGVASSLICFSLAVLRERGMAEAALGVDTENVTGAFRLYQSLGYQLTRSHGFYRRVVESA
jgi:mycothiol synthase